MSERVHCLSEEPLEAVAGKLKLKVLGVEQGPERFSLDDDEIPPRTSTWRCNLAVLSQRRNLLFTAHVDKIYVWEPAGPLQTLGATPAMILTPVMKNPTSTGYIDIHNPHAINNILVDDLGRDEVLLLVTDSGNVCGYRVETIFSALESADESVVPRPVDGSPIQPFFVEHVYRSAWGLAVHKFARLIAVSSNTGWITVFAFALVDPSTSLGEEVGETAVDGDDSDTFVGQTWLSVDTQERLTRLQRNNGRPSRSRNLRLTFAGHETNIPCVAFVNSDLDPNGTWMLSTDIDNKLIVWSVWDNLEPIRVYDILRENILARATHPDDGVRGWSVLALDPRSFHSTKCLHEAYGGEPKHWESHNHVTFDITTLSRTVRRRYLKDAADETEGASLLDLFNSGSSDSGDFSTSEDDTGSDVGPAEHSLASEQAEGAGMAHAYELSDQEMTNDSPARNDSTRSGSEGSASGSDDSGDLEAVSIEEDYEGASDSDVSVGEAEELDSAHEHSGDEDEDSTVDNAEHTLGNTVQIYGEITGHGASQNDREMVDDDVENTASPEIRDSIDPDDILDQLLSVHPFDLPQIGNRLVWGTPPTSRDGETSPLVTNPTGTAGPTEGEQAARSQPASTSAPIEFPILHFSESQISLLYCQHAQRPGVICNRPLREANGSDAVWSLQAIDRFNMVKYIPEQGIVVAASQKGRAAILTLTETSCEVHPWAFRVDWIVPSRHQEEEQDARPLAPLLGMTVAPMQGFELPPDVPVFPNGADTDDEVTFHFRELHRNCEDGATRYSPTTYDEQKPTMPKDHLQKERPRRSKILTVPECHAHATRAYRPDESWRRGSGPSRHYRLLLLYRDHSVLSYEFWYEFRKLEDDDPWGEGDDAGLLI